MHGCYCRYYNIASRFRDLFFWVSIYPTFFHVVVNNVTQEISTTHLMPLQDIMKNCYGNHPSSHSSAYNVSEYLYLYQIQCVESNPLKNIAAQTIRREQKILVSDVQCLCEIAQFHSQTLTFLHFTFYQIDILIITSNVAQIWYWLLLLYGD